MRRYTKASAAVFILVSLQVLAVSNTAISALQPRRHRVQSTNSADTHVQEVIESLEGDNSLRFALMRGARGDGIHFAWMDQMKRFGAKQAAFQIHFERKFNRTEFKIQTITYLYHYYRYDKHLNKPAVLRDIRASGLQNSLATEILARSPVMVDQLNFAINRSSFCGTLFVNLLDDEALPILNDMPKVRTKCAK